MDYFVARQAIFDRELNVWGYELLFRPGLSDRCETLDGEAATVRVIASGLFEPGFENLLHGRRATVNFDRALLVSEMGRELPLPPGTVIEILETVEPDEAVLAACAALRVQGFWIALDDYTGDPKLDPLLDVADLLKVDVLAIPVAMQETILARARELGFPPWLRKWKHGKNGSGHAGRATTIFRVSSSPSQSRSQPSRYRPRRTTRSA